MFCSSSKNTPKWICNSILYYRWVYRYSIYTYYNYRWHMSLTCVPQVRVSGFHSMVQHTRTTVLWSWRTLVKVMMMACFAWLNTLPVANSLPSGIGSSLMELEFLAVVTKRTCTEQEVIWWYVCTGGEVEWMEFTAVRYLMQWISSRPYTLECTQQVLVSSTRMYYSGCVADEWWEE